MDKYQSINGQFIEMITFVYNPNHEENQGKHTDR
jgi:hypothetical protein